MSDLERFLQAGQAAQRAVDELGAGRPPALSLSKDEAHEASQGAYMQAAWLEERSNNEPDRHKRRELLNRAYKALSAAEKLRACS